MDLELTGAQRATIDWLLKGEEPIPAPAWLALEAAIDGEMERHRAAADPAAFWAEKAQGIEWFEPCGPHHPSAYCTWASRKTSSRK